MLRTPLIVRVRIWGNRGSAMLRSEAESAIIDEWMSLSESERMTERQAAQFALQMKRKYHFDYVGGDTYLEIRRMMMRHQNRIVA
jgi:hypothetical protein